MNLTRDILKELENNRKQYKESIDEIATQKELIKRLESVVQVINDEEELLLLIEYSIFALLDHYNTITNNKVKYVDVKRLMTNTVDEYKYIATALNQSNRKEKE